MTNVFIRILFQAQGPIAQIFGGNKDPDYVDDENTEINVLYDDQDISDYQVLDVCDIDKPTSLSASIQVVITTLNNNYLEDCLLNLLINFVNKNTNPLLRDKFFPELKIQELTDLHINLREDLKFVEVDFKKIGEVFKKYEKDFPVIPKPALTKVEQKAKGESEKLTK